MSPLEIFVRLRIESSAQKKTPDDLTGRPSPGQRHKLYSPSILTLYTVRNDQVVIFL